MSLRSRLAGLRDLAAFMTGIPLGGGSLEAAARAFPLVPLIGALEGVIASLALAALGALGAGGLLAGAVYLAVHAAVTGSIHLDGFADYADVIGSRARGRRALEVLKDPRRGSHAAVWTAVILIASAAAAGELAALASSHRAWIPAASLVTAVYASSSEAMYMVLALGPREPYQGLAGLFKDNMDSRGHAVNAAAYAAVSALTLASTQGPLGLRALVAGILAAPLPLSLAAARDAESRLGFVNGDVAGFAYEASRTALLAVAAVAAGVVGVGV